MTEMEKRILKTELQEVTKRLGNISSLMMLCSSTESSRLPADCYRASIEAMQESIMGLRGYVVGMMQARDILSGEQETWEEQAI